MLVRKLCGKGGSAPSLGKRDLPYTVAMVVLDIAAPILLLFGVANTTAANVSLLNNFEIVATAGIAVAVFREKISGRLWCAVFLVVAASMILGTEAGEVLVFNRGSLCVIGACLCWGVENNCTRRISDKDPEQIVWIKGIFPAWAGLPWQGCSGKSCRQRHSCFGRCCWDLSHTDSVSVFILWHSTGSGRPRPVPFIRLPRFWG